MLARAWGLLEWSFAVILIVLVLAAALFGVFVAVNLFRNPDRRHGPPR